MPGRFQRLVVAALVLSSVSGCAATTGPAELNADVMTASGRLGLERAAPESRFFEALDIDSYRVDADAMLTLGLDAESTPQQMREGLERSLDNHDFLAPEGDDARYRVSVEAAHFQTEAARSGEYVIAKLSFVNVEPDHAAPCLKQEISARWMVLDPARSGAGHGAQTL